MIDVTGKQLSVGDKVAFIPQNGYTCALSVGVIIGFTKQKVRIQLTNKCWSYSDDECLKYPEQCSKVEV